MFRSKKENNMKISIGKIVLIFAILFLVGIVFATYYFIKNTNPAKVLSLPIVQKQVAKQLGQASQPILADLPDWLGLNQPRTYLLLFLNNTELRPGGGFIGSYAVVRWENGRPSILKVEGAETIDRAANKELLPKPPEVLSKHLNVDHWYFRDSNWSPDFAVSSQNVLDLYKKENGTAANEIDAVIGVTTNVLEEIIRRSVSITAGGIEFTADNVIEKLEYEVEYGYRDKGVAFADRKKTLGDLFHELIRRLGPDMIKHPADYLALVEKLAWEKHLMAFSPDAELQKRLVDYGWTGTFAPTTSDYVWWIDANLAALKTDYAMKRELKYELSSNSAGNYVATTTMTYTNTGKFDWRTTRYRTYARVYVPNGAELLKVTGSNQWDRTTEPDSPTINKELDSTVFGAFIYVEPGANKTLSFVYRLPATIGQAIKKGTYSLSVPKQLGTNGHRLTLDLNFGTNITSAKPAEEEKNWGDTNYSLNSDLQVDRNFEIKL